MSLRNNPSASLLRLGALLCLTAGLLFLTGATHSAFAGRADDTPLRYGKSNFNSSKARPKKARRVSASHNKTRKALRKVKTSSLVRRPSRHNAKRRTVRRYHGLHPRLSRLLAIVKNHYGRSVSVTSGCRSHKHNRRVGGAKRSMHLRCMAVDFRVAGVSKARLRRYVSGLPGRGGVGIYCGRSIVHLDVGPRRSWVHGCGKRRRSRRSRG